MDGKRRPRSASLRAGLEDVEEYAVVYVVVVEARLFTDRMRNVLSENAEKSFERILKSPFNSVTTRGSRNQCTTSALSTSPDSSASAGHVEEGSGHDGHRHVREADGRCVEDERVHDVVGRLQHERERVLVGHLREERELVRVLPEALVRRPPKRFWLTSMRTFANAMIADVLSREPRTRSVSRWTCVNWPCTSTYCA
jgi:hypothetical protein